MNFIRKLSRGKFYLSNQSVQIRGFIRGWKLATNAKFQLIISKIMPAKDKKTQGHGCEYHYSSLVRTACHD